MTRQKNDTQDENESQASFEAMLREKLQQAVRVALISVLEEEVDAFIGAARYERSEQRQDYRNGHYARSLDTSVGHLDVKYGCQDTPLEIALNVTSCSKCRYFTGPWCATGA